MILEFLHYFEYLIISATLQSAYSVIVLLSHKHKMSLRECLSMGAAGAQTHKSLGHHLLHLQILRILVLLKPADFDAQSSLLHPQIQIPNACPVTRRLKVDTQNIILSRRLSNKYKALLICSIEIPLTLTPNWK